MYVYLVSISRRPLLFIGKKLKNCNKKELFERNLKWRIQFTDFLHDWPTSSTGSTLPLALLASALVYHGAQGSLVSVHMPPPQHNKKDSCLVHHTWTLQDNSTFTSTMLWQTAFIVWLAQCMFEVMNYKKLNQNEPKRPSRLWDFASPPTSSANGGSCRRIRSSSVLTSGDGQADTKSESVRGCSVPLTFSSCFFCS